MVVSLAFCELTATDTMMRKMGAPIHPDALRTGNVVNNSAFPFIIDYASAPHLDFCAASRERPQDFHLVFAPAPA
jgi:hypothetical protein